MPEETRDQFEARYGHGDPAWVPFRASIQCHCDYEECTGWGMVPISEITTHPMHYNTDAERKSALEHHETLLENRRLEQLSN